MPTKPQIDAVIGPVPDDWTWSLVVIMNPKLLIIGLLIVVAAAVGYTWLALR